MVMRSKMLMSFEPGFAGRMRKKAAESGRTVSGLVAVAVSRFMKGRSHE